MDAGRHLRDLNSAQRSAVEHGIGGDGRSPPLLIAAGAGTGKTKTLAHRVAHLILNGADPHRILLLTFSRRAAGEMTRRTHGILAEARGAAQGSTPNVAILPWSGTFHAVGSRLLRLHAAALGLDENFTVLDRGDAADLMNLERSELGLAETGARFPQKDICLAIYSYTVNACSELGETLEQVFPWCGEWEKDLRRLFAAYLEAKQRDNVLDYDDLVLYWRHAMAEPAIAAAIGARFDHVLVDEYQDTNALQEEILLALRPDGTGLTVVGDDAQSIYSFRAATVRNIRQFPGRFSPPAAIVTLEENYRSTQPILDVANVVIGQCRAALPKRLFSTRSSAERPELVSVEDESAQARWVADRILDHREAGIALKQQAVLFRTSHHSDLLEIELGRRNIPFVKYGGLKFLEAAHVKDLLAILRWAENPRDAIAAFRALHLLPGIGPAKAKAALGAVAANQFKFEGLECFSVPAAAALAWPPFCRLLTRLHDKTTPWPGQVGIVRDWYAPHLERLYDYAPVRTSDLHQLEQIAGTYASRERFLTELTLDPPDATGAEAGAPQLDEDYLVLSTIHSAKGQEWQVVFVLNLADGCIPSDMAAGRPEQIDEERRLLYVALTRAREHLYLLQPLRFYRTQQRRNGAGFVMAPRSRFLTQEVIDACFQRSGRGVAPGDGARASPPSPVDIGAKLREMWR